MNRASCKGCKYHFSVDGHSKIKICHYMYITGHSRDCSPEKCDKKEIGRYKDIPKVKNFGGYYG